MTIEIASTMGDEATPTDAYPQTCWSHVDYAMSHADFSRGLHPFGDVSTALPFLLAYFLAAKPLDAYADGVASKGYAAALQATAPAWAAGTLGGVALRALGTFSAPDVGTTLLTFISTAVFLGGARAAAVYKETGELPDLDAITSQLGGD